MKQIIKLTAFLGCLILIIGSCEKDTEPTWVAPEMTLEVVAQSDITRKEATLQGSIGKNELDITECGFAYSKTKALLEKKVFTDNNVTKVPVENTSGTCRVKLEGLEPGTNYFYCIYITCGNTTVTSPDILQFSTTANNAPELAKVAMISEADNQSLSVQSSIVSIGAESITLCGFCYAKGADKDPTLADQMTNIPEDEMPDLSQANKEFSITIDGLEASTDYTVRAYAMNDAGSVGYGEKTVLRTANAEKPTVRTYEDADVRGDYAVVSAEITDEGTAKVTTRGFCWSSTNASPMLGACEGNVEVALNDSKIFASEITGLKEGTTYYVRSYAINDKGTGYGNKITITTTSVTEATVTLADVYNITTTTAQLAASVGSNGNGTINERGFCWSSSSQKPEIGAAGCESHAIEGENFTLVLSNLKSNQTPYWVVAYVKNEKGIAYSEVKSFETQVLDVPELATPTIPEANITISSALFNSSIVSNNNSDIKAKGFCYSSTNNKPTIEDNPQPIEGNTFSLQVNELKYGTTYYVRAYATNGVGTGYSTSVSFTTTNILIPALNHVAISNITTDGATFTATITSTNNGTIKEKGFCWSTTNSNPTYEDSKQLIDDKNTTFAYKLSGLTNGTRYYVRAFAKNEAGISYTGTQEFVTTALSVPNLSMPNVSDITTTSAKVVSSIESNGNATVSEKGFCWNTTGTPDLKTSKKVEGDQFTFVLNELEFGKTYYVWAYAKNSVGTGYSQANTFTTVSIQEPSMEYYVNISNVGISEATFTSTISSANNGTISKKGFCWSTTNSNPTITDSKQLIEDKGMTFTYKLTGLTNGTRYYVRAFAENEAGISYTSSSEFTTTALNVPTLSMPIVNSTTINSAYVFSSINDNGNSAITEKGFCWNTTGKAPDLKADASQKVTGDQFNLTITGLTFGKTYYVWAYATNGVGTGFSDSQTFTTTNITTPEMYSTDISAITTTSATLSTTIYNTNNGKISQKGFCWSSTNPEPTIADSHKDITTDGNTFSHSLTGLQPGVTYYVRAYSKNEAGLAYNSMTSFTTTATYEPSIGDLSVNEITLNSAKATARINSNGNLTITKAGFYWSKTNNTPGAADNVKEWKDPTNNLLTFEMTELQENTTYYIRAFATNSKGTVVTSTYTFTTPINPVPGDDDMENPGN